MRIILAALAAFFMSVAQATPVGTVVVGAKSICDTEAQFRQVWNAHRTADANAAYEVMQALAEERNSFDEPVCGYADKPMIVVRVIESAILQWPRFGNLMSHFVEMRAPSGRAAFGVTITNDKST